MADTIGTLLVEISTEASKLNAGLKDAEAKVQATAGKISEVTTKIALGMTAVGAAITGAFALMIKASVDYGDQIYETSQRTGVAVDTLSRLKYVADQTESSFEAVAMGLKFLNKNIYEATSGNKKANESFRALGITLKDEVTGETLKAEEVFFKIADAFQGIDDAATKTALAMQIFGRQGEALIPILNLGSGEIKRLSQEAERLGLVLTSENAKAIDQFSDSSKSLKAAFSGLWLEISQLLIPALENLIKFATNMVVKIRGWIEAHEILSGVLAGVTLAFGALLLVIGPLVLVFNQVIQAVLFLNFLFPKLTLNINALGVALKALNIVTIAAAAAFAGWKLGEWIENNAGKIQKFEQRIKALWDSIFHKPKGPVMEFGWGKPEAPAAPSGETPSVPSAGIDETINLVERHVQKLKELNESYIAGRITAMQYYEAVKTLHKDGLDATIALGDAVRDLAYATGDLNDKKMQEAIVIEELTRAVQEYGRIKAELANQDQIDQANSLNAATNFLRTLQSMHVTIWQGIFDFVNMGVQKMSQGLTTAISSIILGTQKAGEAFKNFGKMMVEAIVEFLVQWAVQAAISIAMGWALAKIVTKVADQIAQAWLRAAILASVATMGGADIAGVAGLAGAMGAGMALFKGMQTAGTATELTTLGEGGIVTQPTLALIGERGPEMVVPLGKMGNTINNYITIESPIINNDMDIRELAEKLGENVKDEMKRP